MSKQSEIIPTNRRVKTPELARIIGVTDRTIANYRKARRIPFLKITPRTIYYDVDAVMAALRRGVASEGTGEFREKGAPAN